MTSMTQSTNMGGQIGPVSSLKRLAAEEVARQINFRPNGPTGTVHGDPLLYHLAATDPRAAAGMAQGRSEAVSKYHFDQLNRYNNDGWWAKADRILGYRRPYGELIDRGEVARMRQVVADDGAMARYYKLENPPAPGGPSNLAHFMFTAERWGMGRPAVYPPELNDYLLHRIHGYPQPAWQGFFDPVTELQNRYHMTQAQAAVALHEIYQDFLAGRPP